MSIQMLRVIILSNMNQVYKNSIFLLLIFIYFSCDIGTQYNNHNKLSNEDLISILDAINVPEKGGCCIFISIDEYLNDSTFVISVNQHSVEVSEIDQLKLFNYRGMDTFFNSKRHKIWVPDSYFKQIMITVSECSFQYYELSLLGSKYLDDTECVIDSANILDENDIY